MLGAALGGAMADLLGWRWEFGVQVLPLLVCMGICLVAIPEDLGLQGKKEGVWEALKMFDFRGSVLLTVSITFFVLGLVSILYYPSFLPWYRIPSSTID
jgi:predicted MFS family arabinose efflux permease